MKKAAKNVAFLLVLTLVVSVLSSLGFNTQPVKADPTDPVTSGSGDSTSGESTSGESTSGESTSGESTGTPFNVLEIVPDMSMATFAYLVVQHSDPDLDKVGDNFYRTNVAINNVDTYLKGKGYRSSSGENTNYFVEYVLKVAKPSVTKWNVTVNTKTPATVSDTDIARADFIIFNQTVPTALQEVPGYRKNQTFFNNDFSDWNIIYKIFKKIAGVNGKPIPYMIDYAFFNYADYDLAANTGKANVQWKDIRLDNEKPNTWKNKNGVDQSYADVHFSFLQADKVHYLHDSDSSSFLTIGKQQKDNRGMNNNFYKLFKMLTNTDPATFYGTYFVTRDDTYGIDDDGNLVTCGFDYNVNPMSFNQGVTKKYWAEEYLRPYFLTTSGIGIGSVETKMNNAPVYSGSNVYKVIGGEKGSGILYGSSSDGIFSVMDGTKTLISSSSGGATLSGTDVSSQVTKSFDVSDNNAYEGSDHYTVTFSLETNRGSNINNWAAVISATGIEEFSVIGEAYAAQKIGNYYVITPQKDWNNVLKNGSGQGFNSQNFVLTAGQGTLSKTALTTAFSNVKIYSDFGGGASTVKGADRLATIENLFLNGNKNDYHTYRFLFISDNYEDAGINRSVIADLVQDANNHNKGLVGGIQIDCMSTYQFENLAYDLNQTYDAIYDGRTTTGSLTTKYGTYTGTTISTSSTTASAKRTDVVNQLKNIINPSSSSSEKFGVQYRILPTEYKSKYLVDYKDQDGIGGYNGYGSMKLDDNDTYINSADINHRTMDFAFTVTKSGSYSVVLYVDKNHDDIFDDSDSSDEKHPLGTASGNHEFTADISVDSVLEKDFVGGFAWKLVISKGSDYCTHYGFSAIRKKSGDEDQKIRILQIYPTDYSEEYHSSVWVSSPMLLLPESTEIDGRDISSYSDRINTSTGLSDLSKFFSGKLKVDQTDTYITDNSTYNSATVAPVTYTYGSMSDGRRNNVLYNAAFFYYFIDQLDGYEIDVRRYSVYNFNKKLNTDGNVYYDEVNHKFGEKTKKLHTNINGTPRYVKPISSFGSDELAKKVGGKNKYLVCEKTGDIYGYREEDSAHNITVKYYTSADTGVVPVMVDAYEYYDLVMLGFGSTMDYMLDSHCNKIKDYLENDGAAFIGNGTVTTNTANNTLGNKIRNTIGMSDSLTGQDDQNPGNGGIATMMVTNDTLFSHYPYSVPHYMKNTSSAKQPYQLDLSKDVIVSFTKYGLNGSDYSNWGHARYNYFLYKYGAITFCGFGSTIPNEGWDQRGGVMTMSENVMLVNALVTTSKFKSDGKHDDPYINCVDDDRSVLPPIKIGDVEDDEKTEETQSSKLLVRDAVYTDYDAFGITQNQKGEFIFSTSATVNPVKSTALRPDGMTETQAGTNIRWVPYEATNNTTGTVLEIKTEDGIALPLTVYQKSKDSDGKVIFVNPTYDGSSTNRIKITRSTTYYIGVPLNEDQYSVSSTKPLGFKFGTASTSGESTGVTDVNQFVIHLSLQNGGEEKELHTLSMIRRVMYPVE